MEKSLEKQIEEIESKLKKDRQNHNLQYSLVELYLSNEQKKNECLSLIKNILKENKNDIPGLMLLEKFHEKNNNKKKLKSCLQKIDRIDGHNIKTLEYIMFTYYVNYHGLKPVAFTRS